MDKKFKSIAQEPIDIDEKSNTVVVYYSSFNTEDKAKEVVLPGAFTKTLSELGPKAKDQIYHFKNHKFEVSKPRELFTDNYGLKSIVEFPNTTMGRDTIEEYKFGMWKYHSFGYAVIKQQQKGEFTELLELKLYEGSHVLYPCNDNAVTNLVDLKSEEEALSILKQMQSFIRNSKATDDAIVRMENQLKEINQQYTELKTLITEPHISTQPTKEDILSVFSEYKN